MEGSSSDQKGQNLIHTYRENHTHIHRPTTAEIKEGEEFGSNNQSAEIPQSNTKSQQCSTRDEWLISIDNYTNGTAKKPKIIERIPSILREIESHKKCYDPLVVSIGPYHHGKPELETLEKLKIAFAKQFLRACGDQVSIKQLCAKVEEVASNARECYEEGSTEIYDDESFIRMMFLDGCFVLQFMCILTKTASMNSDKTETVPKEGDPILEMKSYYMAFVWRDMFLLENQIPLLVLKILMKYRFKRIEQETELFRDFFSLVCIMPPQETSYINKVKKFVRKCLTSDLTEQNQEMLKFDDSPHLLDLIRAKLIGPSACEDVIPRSSNYWHSYRSVTELETAGIHFKASKTPHVTDVKFKSHHIFGTLMLPPIMVDDITKPLLLNLVAYEISPHGPSDLRITSYIWLMDSLIDHAEDVKQLRKKGILLNNLGSDEQLAQLFNELANDLVPDPRAYADVKDLIEKHCKNKRQVWIAEWMHNHFSSPWTVLAFLGAIFAIALSLVQTYLAVFPHKSS